MIKKQKSVCLCQKSKDKLATRVSRKAPDAQSDLPEKQGARREPCNKKQKQVFM